MGEPIFLRALVGDPNVGDVWGQKVETAKAIRSGVGFDVEEIGDRRANGEVLKFSAEAKTVGGAADGLIHRDDKIWDGVLTH